MLKIETARKLKKAGLVWQPKAGDAFIPSDFEDEIYICDGGREPEPDDLWLPSISDMIAKLDRLGWEFSLTLTDAACQVSIWSRKGFRDFMDVGRNYSDLVGQALLFALSCEKRKVKK